ncbi:MAG: GAF domain-containing sensor histidine kinase [Anaerolineales bacterium]
MMLLTREQLQDRLLALYRASLEVISEPSLETVLERIVRAACELADAQYAALAVLDEKGEIRHFIAVGMSQEEIQRVGPPPRGRGLIGALMQSEHPIRVADVRQDARSAGFPTHHPEMTSFLGVPIRHHGVPLGQIYLTNKKTAPEFSEDDEQIIQMLAAYAAVAIQNARLIESLNLRDAELTRRAEDLSLLNNIAPILASTLELNEILNKTLGVVMEYMSVEAGEIFLLEDDGQTLRLVLHRGEAAEAFWTRNRFRRGEGLIGLALAENRPVISTDLQNDARFLRDAVWQAGFSQLACFPLGQGDKAVGVMSIATRRKEPFEERSLSLLQAIAQWAGLAIENARLHQDARRLAVLEERQRIGMDLHDGVIQSIFAVGLSLEHAAQILEEDPDQARQRIQRAISDLNKTIRDLRTYILDLRPRQLVGEGLMQGLQRLVAEYRTNTLSDAVLQGPAEVDLAPQKSLALFHICQEALANAAKHARASMVTVSVWQTEERVVLEVQDNGRGFDPNRAGMLIGHGLANMQTRARMVGGEVEITSAPGEGTTVLAWVPRG